MKKLASIILSCTGCMLSAAASVPDTVPTLHPEPEAAFVVQDTTVTTINIVKATADSMTYAETVTRTVVSEIPDNLSRPRVLQPIDIDLSNVERKHLWVSPYALPYSRKCTGGQNWGRMWANVGVLSAAFVSTLFVLECLPEDATAWNRESIQSKPPLQRWYKNIFVHDPEIDHDNGIFNYVLHPYAGAAYFMAARSCGFSFWGSMLCSAAVSTIGWEFGIEAFMERPSYQDIVITPVVGSILGECFYRGKRTIVEHGYELLGSSFLGHAACFILDPVNEVIDLFRGNPARVVGAKYKKSRQIESSFVATPQGVSLAIRF